MLRIKFRLSMENISCLSVCIVHQIPWINTDFCLSQAKITMYPYYVYMNNVWFANCEVQAEY